MTAKPLGGSHSSGSSPNTWTPAGSRPVSSSASRSAACDGGLARVDRAAGEGHLAGVGAHVVGALDEQYLAAGPPSPKSMSTAPRAGFDPLGRQEQGELLPGSLGRLAERNAASQARRTAPITGGPEMLVHQVDQLLARIIAPMPPKATSPSASTNRGPSARWTRYRHHRRRCPSPRRPQRVGHPCGLDPLHGGLHLGVHLVHAEHPPARRTARGTLARAASPCRSGRTRVAHTLSTIGVPRRSSRAEPPGPPPRHGRRSARQAVCARAPAGEAAGTPRGTAYDLRGSPLRASTGRTAWTARCDWPAGTTPRNHCSHRRAPASTARSKPVRRAPGRFTGTPPPGQATSRSFPGRLDRVQPGPRRTPGRGGSGRVCARRPGLRGVAHAAAVEDHPVAEHRPVALREQLAHLGLDLHRVVLLRPAEAPGQPAEVGVDGDAGHVDFVARDDVGRLAADAGQRLRGLELGGAPRRRTARRAPAPKPDQRVRLCPEEAGWSGSSPRARGAVGGGHRGGRRGRPRTGSAAPR